VLNVKFQDTGGREYSYSLTSEPVLTPRQKFNRGPEHRAGNKANNRIREPRRLTLKPNYLFSSHKLRDLF